MASDAWFTTGSSHITEGTCCQDYAIASGPYAIVSDGCSSSPMTDVGARFLALGAMDSLRKSDYARLLDDGPDIDLVIPPVLPNEGLDASILHVGCFYGFWAAGITGDGLIVARCPDGLHVSFVDWAGNMPGYLSYTTDPIRLAQFVEQSEYFASADRRSAFQARGYHISEEGCIATWADYRIAQDGLKGFQAKIPYEADVVAAFSDGVCQISGVPWHEAVATLMDFKGPLCGPFVKRRMRAVLKAWAKEGKAPVDDISMGAVSRGV